MPRRRDDAQYDATRNRILDAAVSLFGKNGYEGTRLEDVADVVGVTKVAIYYYFPKKSDLLIEICARAIEESLERQERILSSGDPPDVRLRNAVADHVRGMAANVAVWNVFFRELDLPATNEPRRRAIRKQLRVYGDRFEQLIAEGVEQGVFRAVDVRVVSNAILGMVNWAHRWIHGEQPEAVSEAMLGLIESGLLANPKERRATLG